MKSNEWQRNWVHKTFNTEIQKRRPNSNFLQNWFPSEIRSPPLYFAEISTLGQKYSWMIQNALKSNEWWKILVHKTFKIQKKGGGQSNSDFLQNWFPQEIRIPLFNLWKFKNSEKGTPESRRMQWNLMNDEEIGSIKLLKFKYRRGDQKI